MTPPLEDIVAEGRRVAGAAQDASVTLRVTGGVGIALTCPSAASPPLNREYGDLDVVGYAKERAKIIEVMRSAGYLADDTFNAMHGARRLFFWDATNERQVDVFLDQVEMCHTIDLRRRLNGPGPALFPSDLLLMKLQVVEANAKDLQDILTLLLDCEVAGEASDTIDTSYLSGLAAGDWGLWRTITMVLERAQQWAEKVDGLPDPDRIRDRSVRLAAALHDVPKSRSWKLRARIGDRKRWYELPEDSGAELGTSH